MVEHSTFAARAIRHVDEQAVGSEVDPDLRVTLNFHPDRLHEGVPILGAMATAGTYRSQFETGTSNGGLTAHPGGDRWRWEQRIFGGAYDQAPAEQRPKYGALNHRARPVGGAPRFGSAHVRLAVHTLERTTFCYPDSVFEPEHVGTATRMDLTRRADEDLTNGVTDDLDSYVEAHVHGVVSLAGDVEAIVLDPVYRGGEVEVLAGALPCPVEWHGGFSVAVETVRAYPDYRGPACVALAEELAEDGRLDPAILGRAAATGRHDPQELKRVWHHLARFGAPG